MRKRKMIILVIGLILYTVLLSICMQEDVSAKQEIVEIVPTYIIVSESELPIEDLEVEETLSIYNEEDLYWLSRIISAEAKGEGVRGQIAVGNVVMNRVKSDKYPNTIKDVIFQKGQFCPITNGSIYDEPTEQAMESAKKVLDGEVVVDERALFFYAPRWTSRGSWIRTRTVVDEIGNHRFAQ